MPDCVDCARPFTITDNEAAFFAGRGLALPRRCSPCRRQRRERQSHLSDLVLTCARCRQAFTFTMNEQQFYADHDFVTPRRCLACRTAAITRGSIASRRA